MCGIAGLWFPRPHVPTAAEWRLIEELFVINDFRGGDAAGFYVATKRHQFMQAKDSVLAHQIINTPEWLNASQRAMWGIVVHARKSTVALHNAQANHPHDTPQLVGVHNGTLTNWEKTYGKHVSDSAALFAYLSEEQPRHQTDWEATIMAAYKQMSGAATICFTPKRHPDTLWWAKEGRPLGFALLRNGTVAWSSDDDHLGYVLNLLQRWLPVEEVLDLQPISYYTPADGTMGHLTAPELRHAGQPTEGIDAARKWWRNLLHVEYLPVRPYYYGGASASNGRRVIDGEWNWEDEWEDWQSRKDRGTPTIGSNAPAPASTGTAISTGTGSGSGGLLPLPSPAASDSGVGRLGEIFPLTEEVDA